MREPSERLLSCTDAEALIHRLLDGDLMDATQRTRLDEHVDDCAACRAAQAELRMVQDGLRALVETPLADEALQRVWRRTSRGGLRIFRDWGLDWRMAAAAASIALLAWVGVTTWRPQPTGPTDAEIAQAAQDARMVFQLTSRALETTGQVAIREVLTEQISPALQRVPLRWPGSTRQEGDES